MNILIDDRIKELTPNFHVGVMTCDVVVEKDNGVTPLIEAFEQEVMDTIDITDVVTMDIIIDGRNAYKKYGKDPSRYRLAVESLFRRLSKGNKLYRINNVVDLGNVLSIKTRKSVAVLDYNSIQGDIKIRLGTSNDEYYGIGRGILNVENIPVYEDEINAFGSVTSDTERTMIRDNTSKVLIFIISFSGINGLYEELEYAKKIYRKYAKATNFDMYTL